MKKFLLLLGFSLLAIIFQIIIALWLSIQNIKPDFVLILVMFVALLQGRVFGQLYGFGIGLIIDIIGIGSFFGLSALSKTVAGFLAGYFKNRRNRFNHITFYSIYVLVIFIHFAIFFLINFKSSDYGTQLILLRYVLPETIYTSIIFILLDYIFSIESY